jgi:hypothetical protein
VRHPATRVEGIAYLLKGCAGGFPASCRVAAETFAPVVGAAASCPRALPVAARACADGEPSACAIADACALEMNRDAATARRRLDFACENGISIACFYWADASGEPDGADSVKRAYERACNGSSVAQPLACTRMAVLKLATATAADETASLASLLRRACDLSIGEACCAIAERAQNGSWPGPDVPDPAELRTKACNLGAERCCRPDQPRL